VAFRVALSSPRASFVRTPYDVRHSLLLLDLGADVKKGSGWYHSSALHYACEKGFVSLIRRLVEMGADISAQDNIWRTPLIHACEQGQEAAAHLLLDLGADGSRGEDRRCRSVLELARASGLLVSVTRRLEASQVLVSVQTPYTSSAQSQR
jgi:ankyrin repeat protein